MRAVVIGLVMIVTSLAIIMTLSTVLESHAERGHAVEANFDPHENSIVSVASTGVVTVVQKTSSFFQRMAHRIFRGHEEPLPEPEK